MPQNIQSSTTLWACSPTCPCINDSALLLSSGKTHCPLTYANSVQQSSGQQSFLHGGPALTTQLPLQAHQSCGTTTSVPVACTELLCWKTCCQKLWQGTTGALNSGAMVKRGWIRRGETVALRTVRVTGAAAGNQCSFSKMQNQSGSWGSNKGLTHCY